MEEKFKKRFVSFQRSLAALEEARRRDLSDPFVLSGTGAKYSITFELAWKVMKDILVQHYAIVNFVTGSPKEVLKQAFSAELIDDQEWMEMLRVRNELAHDYDEMILREYCGQIIGKYTELFFAFESRAEQLLKAEESQEQEAGAAGAGKSKRRKEMETVTLGSTGITVNKNGFGALPVQRVTKREAVKLIRRAYDGGICFFDTARAYSDSEEKLGEALEGIRDQVYLATKTMAQNAEDFWKDLEASLRSLKTGYIDIYQFHNPAFCPKPGDGTGLYEAMVEAKAQGKVRHIGITNHRLAVAKEAIVSGLYETMQFPFCYLATEKDMEIVELCKKHNMGFIAMKALSGGLINDSRAAYAFEAQFDNVLPIWGVQREEELDEFLSYIKEPPVMTEEIRGMIERDKQQLSGDFCRGCGYCMPCPAGIEINNCARMSLMLRRAPSEAWLTDEWQRKMAKIEDCLHCNQCMSKCPYGLHTPELLERNYEDYQRVLRGEVRVK